MQNSLSIQFKIQFILLILLALIGWKNLFAVDLDSTKFGKNTRVDSIKIVGNDKTEEFIILREMSFHKGDSVNQEILHFNRERIFSLGLFSKVELALEETENVNMVVVQVEETWYIYPVPFWYVHKGDINNSTLGMNLTWKNFRGRNETIRSSIGIGFDSYISIQYDNPAYFYDDAIGFTFGFNFTKYSNRNRRAEQIAGSEYNYKYIKGYLGVYKRLNQYNILGINAGYEYWQANTYPQNKITATGKSVDNFPGVSLFYFYDTRDLKQFSQDGILTYLNYAHKGFGINGISYNDFEIDFRGYKTLSDPVSSKFRFNYRQTFGAVVPFYDYSFLGYGEKIRGHYTDYIEGNNSLLTSFELSVPLVEEWNVSLDLPLIPRSLTSARIGIYLNAFTDAGTTFNNDEPLVLNNFSSGYGFGLTFLVLPFNAIRFEYAFNELGKGEFLFATGFSF